MATETAFRSFREILDETDEHGRTKTRWHVGDTSGEEWAYPMRPLPVEIIKDRWDGLMHAPIDPTKLQNRLDRVLWDIEQGLTRRPNTDVDFLVDGALVNGSDIMDLDGLQKLIRDWFIERAAKVAV